MLIYCPDHQCDKICLWLSAPDPSTNYNKALEERQGGTGLWFVSSQTFDDWRTTPNSFVWLHGFSGCGKAILSSTIIEDILKRYPNPTVAVLYFFFDFNDSEKQRQDKMLRSLITQLFLHGRGAPKALSSLYSYYHNGGRQPEPVALVTTLREIFEKFNQTFIILDALDECMDRHELLETLNSIVNWISDEIHLLATSRRERDIEPSLDLIVNDRSKIGIQTKPVDDDIRAYVRGRLHRDPKMRRWINQPEVQTEIEEALMDKAHGM